MAAEKRDTEGWFPYLMVHRSKALVNTGSISFGRMDRRLVRQSELETRDYLWKTYAWGSHQDASLMSYLDIEMSLGEYLKELGVEAGCGWQKKAKIDAPSFIAGVPVIDIKRMIPWGGLHEDWFSEAPTRVEFPDKGGTVSGSANRRDETSVRRVLGLTPDSEEPRFLVPSHGLRNPSTKSCGMASQGHSWHTAFVTWSVLPIHASRSMGTLVRRSYAG